MRMPTSHFMTKWKVWVFALRPQSARRAGTRPGKRRAPGSSAEPARKTASTRRGRPQAKPREPAQGPSGHAPSPEPSTVASKGSRHRPGAAGSTAQAAHSGTSRYGRRPAAMRRRPGAPAGCSKSPGSRAFKGSPSGELCIVEASPLPGQLGQGRPPSGEPGGGQCQQGPTRV